MNQPAEFIIKTYHTIAGAFLSRPGHWGNIPHPTVDDAEAEVRRRFGEKAVIRRELAR